MSCSDTLHNDVEEGSGVTLAAGAGRCHWARREKTTLHQERTVEWVLNCPGICWSG